MKDRFRLAVAAALAVCALPAGSAFAHHSFAAEFDRSKPIEVTGKVTKVEWMNPHARFYIDVKDKDGTTANWNFELTSPNVLMRRGWSRRSLKAGDTITVKGFRAKKAEHVASAADVTLADGRKIFGGASDNGGSQ